jgi:hypothetical protein
MVKKGKLEENIRKQAEEFRKRAEATKDDAEKRHDRIERDEIKAMWRASRELGWSDAKIGGVFDRDPRSVRQHLEKIGGVDEAAPGISVDPEAAHQLIQKWRIEVENLSPIQLLQRWLDEASADALSHFFTDKDTKMFYLKARGPHFETFKTKRICLQVESDPTFRLLRLKFPTSAVWSAFEAWSEQVVPYDRAFRHIEGQVGWLMDLAFDEEGTDDSNLSVFISKFRKYRSYAVLLTCDLLTRSLVELPSNVRWGMLGCDLEKLRVRLNLELSSLTKDTRKGGWSTASTMERIYSDPEDHSGLAQASRGFLTELIKLQSIQDSLAMALQELESNI